MSTNVIDTSGGVVVGFDGSRNAAVAVQWAALEAQRQGTTLHIVSCCYYPGMPFRGAEGGGALPRSAIRATEELAAQGRAIASKMLPEDAVKTHTVTMQAADALIDASTSANLVVVGHRGRGAFASAVLGSVSSAVAQYAGCPVVVVRGAVPESGGSSSRVPVVVGIDGTKDSEPALLFAAQRAARDHVPVRIVCAWLTLEQAGWDLANWQVDSIEEWAQELSKSARHAVDGALALVRGRWPDLEAEGQVVELAPVLALEDASRESQLVVVGSHSNGALGRLMLGSVSRTVLHHAACPVAVVRPAPLRG
ncbi:MAG TPA: universal stress protein [Pedococcus sp.]|nr:universal stress protein [Pedococcus sp.]